MKIYPTIPYYGDYWNLPIYAFDKCDGSNVKFEYSKKRGFYKFGTKNMMIDKTHSEYGFVIDLFLNKYSDGLDKVFRTKTYRDTLSFVCFAELKGKNSSFGQHRFFDDVFDITLFDVLPYNKDFIPPGHFIDDFGHLGIPKLIYTGNLNREFVNRVKDNEFDLEEGVVCKGVIKKDKRLYYCKIKTNKWLDELKSHYPQLYEQEATQIKLELC